MASKMAITWTWQRVAAVVTTLVVVVLLVRTYAHRSAQGAKDTLHRATVSRQDLRVTKTATGEITPQNRVEVKPPIAGRIEEVLVREGDLIKQGDVLAWMSSSDRAALLDAARAQGPETLARWESAYKPAPLISPLDGTVIVRAVEPGQTVATTEPVVVIADRLIVNAQVDETDIGAIKVGQAASISLDAYPDETIPAHVDHIAYEAKTVNNVTIYEVDILPDQVPEFMRSGMTAVATFTIVEKPQALAVPSEAVGQQATETSVLIPGTTWANPEPRRVTTGITDGKFTEITSGLSEGDAILVPSLQMPRSKRNQGRSPFLPFGGRPGGGRGGGTRNR